VPDANAAPVRHIRAPVRRALLACTRLVAAVVIFAVVFVVMVGGGEGGDGGIDLLDALAHVVETRGPIGGEVAKLGLDGRGVGLEPSEGGASVDVDVVVVDVDVVTVVGQG